MEANVITTSTGDISHCLNAGGMGRIDYETETLVTHALTSNGFDASEDGTGRGTPITLDTQGMAVRRLTPKECCRLQGVPDDFFDGVLLRGKPLADGSIYKLLGNSMAVPCIAWLIGRIKTVSGLS